MEAKQEENFVVSGRSQKFSVGVIESSDQLGF